MRGLPAVLDTATAPPDGRACHCFCAARHGARMGVCAGWLKEPGVLVWLNSLWSDGPVAICRPCADAWPDL